jgi:hypothetical protein
MACKFIQGKGFTAFQCNPGQFEYMQDGVVCGNNKKPYEDNECHHSRRFENKGILICQDMDPKCPSCLHDEKVDLFYYCERCGERWSAEIGKQESEK